MMTRISQQLNKNLKSLKWEWKDNLEEDAMIAIINIDLYLKIFSIDSKIKSRLFLIILLLRINNLFFYNL